MRDRAPRDWQLVLKDAAERCERAGRPLTLQRQAVLKTLWRASDHPTADSLFERVVADAPGLSRATVFRSLETLVEVGLARKVGHFGVGVRFDARLDPHHHFICQVCSTITDFEDPNLNDLAPRAPRDYAVGEVAITCVGICPECQGGE